MDFCPACNSTSATQRCSACHSVLYCGANCQKKHWSAHKETCKKIREAEKAGFIKTITQASTTPDKKPNKGATVRMKYRGYLPSGKVFDSNDEGFEFTLGVGQVIRGWDQGIATMAVGEKATICISSEFAYGRRGASGAVPPNSPIVFDVEMLGFN